MTSVRTQQVGAVAPVLNTTGVLQRKCGCGQHTVAGGSCSECQKQKGIVQRKASHGEAVGEVPPNVHEVLRSPGQPLDAQTRAFMEPRFRHDFSGVRIHTDTQAANSARAVNALAYTVGRDIVFGTGRYQPNTGTGRRLLGHELTHTIQQAGAIQKMPNLETTSPTDTTEQEAEKVSRSITDGGEITVRSRGGQSIARQEAPDAGVPTDAGAPNLNAQIECVKRLGGCPNTRSGGIPTPEEIAAYNGQCRPETGYTGPDVIPTDDQCRQTATAPATYTFSITMDGCDKAPFSEAVVRAAARRAFDVVKDTDCVKSSGLKDEILGRFNGLTIECEQGRDVCSLFSDPCGCTGSIFSNTINIYKAALEPGCGLLASTILHEVLHLWSPFRAHAVNYGCEKSCFNEGSGDAANCK